MKGIVKSLQTLAQPACEMDTEHSSAQGNSEREQLVVPRYHSMLKQSKS